MADAERDQELPDGLAARLRDRATSLPFVPTEVDDAVLAAGRKRMGRVRRRRRLMWSAWAAGPVAAAAVALVLWVANPGPTPQTGTPPVAATAPSRITILDAFALARARAAGDTSITSEQIDTMAQQAVALDARGAS